MANGTQLYDTTSNPIYPKTNADYVSCGAIIAGNTVFQDFVAVNSKISNLSTKIDQVAAIASGASQIQNEFGVTVEYSVNNYDKESDARQAAYQRTLTQPTAENPYLWQKTTYYWDESEVATVFALLSSAKFPEVQLMFAVGPLNTNVLGPTMYYDGAQDRTGNSSITWYTYPPRDISNDAPCAFIATRRRPPNGDWTEWKAAKYGQYPVVTS